MKRTIAIIAPMFDPFSERYNMDFSLQLKDSKKQLTMENLYNLFTNNFDNNVLQKENIDQYDTISAAGYYLLSFLRQSGYEGLLTSLSDPEALQKAAAANPMAVCVSATMILNKNSLSRIIKQIRDVMCDVPIIIGGVLVWKGFKWLEITETNYKSDTNIEKIQDYNNFLFPCTKKEIDADVFIVSHHGSQILLNLLKEIDCGKKADFSYIPNIAIPDDNGLFTFTQRSDEQIDYDNDYIHWEYVDSLPCRIPVRTSIGCPFRCGYCDFCYLYPKIYFRSLDSIKSELKTIRNAVKSDPHVSRMINFTDDNVFMTMDRANNLCKHITTSKIGLPWAGFIRSSSVNTENINLIKESGLVRAWIGVESGDSGQLMRMNKKQDLAEVSRGVELLDKQDISVHMTFIVGYPGETVETINNTIGFLNNLKVSMAEYILYPFVISPMSEISFPKAREKWDIKGLFRTWSHKTMTSDQTITFSREIFKKVINVPYYYSQENRFFVQKLKKEKRKEFYKLRHILTLQLMEGKQEESIWNTFKGIAHILEFQNTQPTEKFLHNILYPKL